MKQGIIYDEFGIPRKISVMSAANRLHALKKKSGSNPWPVIEECFTIWEKTHPQQYNSYVIYLDDIRKTRKDPKFASSYDKGNVELAGTGMTLRYTLDIPEMVMKMMRAVYSVEELPMTREFTIEFAHRFPKYMIAQKV